MQIVEYYGACWKIEATFKEFKRDIGSRDTNPELGCSHTPFALLHYGHFDGMDIAERIQKTPIRDHNEEVRNHFAFPMCENPLPRLLRMLISVYFSLFLKNPC
jgi:hypothetical protein